jgi:hypothetical protein
MYKNGTVTTRRRAKELASFKKMRSNYKGISMAVILKSTHAEFNRVPRYTHGGSAEEDYLNA